MNITTTFQAGAKKNNNRLSQQIIELKYYKLIFDLDENLANKLRHDFKMIIMTNIYLR